LKAGDNLLKGDEKRSEEEEIIENNMGTRDDHQDNLEKDFYSAKVVGGMENVNDNDLQSKENERVNAELTMEDLKALDDNNDLKSSKEDLSFKDVKDFKQREHNAIENEDFDMRDDANKANVDKEMYDGYKRREEVDNNDDNDANNDDIDLTWNDYSNGEHLREE